MESRRVWRYWVYGALLTAGLFAFLILVGNLRYENSDDILMVKAFMGFEGGWPADFSLYLHTLLAGLLYQLSLWSPTLAWFSLFQVALLFGSATVLGKGLFQLACRSRLPNLSGMVAGLLYLSVFVAYALCRVNFTTTAALAGAAAVVQTATVDFSASEKGARVRAILLALLLLVCSYCLRDTGALPSLMFVGFVFLWRFFSREEPGEAVSAIRRRVLKTALVFLAVLVALMGVRQAEIRLRGLQDYMAWNNASAELYDYSSFETDPAPAIGAGSGLSPAEIRLMQQWYFLSSNIDTQAMLTMAAAYPPAIEEGFGRFWNLMAGNARYIYLSLVVLLLCGLCLLRLKKDDQASPLLALGAAAAAFALLVYLALRGRLLPRAADAVLMPCAAFILSLAFAGLGASRRRGFRRVAAVALALLVAITAAGSLRLTAKEIRRAQDNVSMQRESDLESYALDNPDLLIVRSPALLRDTRLFPDVRNGVPGNLTIWGDWLCHTPSWNRQLAAFGFDAEHFTGADWLRDNIVLAAVSPEGTEALLQYVAEETDMPVTAEEVGVYGSLEFYRFRPT